MNSTQTNYSAPFPKDYRASGILLHVTSLPSRFGIGDLGPAAFGWIDRLAAAGQTWWQVLPLGPTGYGNSPYQALSSFAATSLVLSPEKLVEEGLLNAADCEGESFPNDHVDFEAVNIFKDRVLSRAWEKFRGGAQKKLRSEFEKFCEEKAELQKDAALFIALRTKLGGAPFLTWPKELVRREPRAIADAVLIDVDTGHAAITVRCEIDRGTARATADFEYFAARANTGLVGEAQPVRRGNPAALPDVLAKGVATHRGLGAARVIAIDVVVKVYAA